MSLNLEIKNNRVAADPVPENATVIEEEHSSVSADSTTTPHNPDDRSNAPSSDNSLATDIDEKEAKAVVAETGHYRDDLFFRLE